MITHRDAIKRHKQSLKRRTRNRHWRSTLRTFVKRVRAAAAEGDAEAAKTALATAVPLIGRVASKGVIHKKTASRLVSRLTLAVNRAASGTGPAPAKKVTRKKKATKKKATKKKATKKTTKKATKKKA